MRSSSNLVTLALALAGGVGAAEYNSFDGPGFPTCYNVTAVHNATSVDESEFETSGWIQTPTQETFPKEADQELSQWYLSSRLLPPQGHRSAQEARGICVSCTSSSSYSCHSCGSMTKVS